MSGLAHQLPEYRIGLDIRRDAITAVRIRQDNPLDPARLVVGRTADAAPDLLAQVLAVCGHAHRAAARGAVAQARGAVADDGGLRDRARAVLEERLLNGVWRLAIDWPRALGSAERPDLIVRVRRATSGQGTTSGPDDLEAVVDQIDRTGLQAAFEAASVARAQPEPGARADRDPSLIADRIAEGFAEPARAVADLAALLGGGRPDPLASGEAGVVMTSRGRLTHACRLSGDRIADYRIEAPTDVLLAPGGPLAAALLSLRGSDLADRARLVTAIFDPCAPVRFERLEPADA